MAKIVFREQEFTSKPYRRQSRTKGVWSRFAAGSSAGVVPAVRRVVMYGLYSARRGEGEFLARQPGKMSYLQLNQRINNENTCKQT